MRVAKETLQNYLVKTLNGELIWCARQSDNENESIYNCDIYDDSIYFLRLIVRDNNIEFNVFPKDKRPDTFYDGNFDCGDNFFMKEIIDEFISENTLEEIQLIRAFAKAVEIIVKLPQLEEDAKDGSWEDDELSLSSILELINDTLTGDITWLEVPSSKNEILNIKHRLFKPYTFEIEDYVTKFTTTSFRYDEEYRNTFFVFYRKVTHGLEKCCILLSEDVENEFMYFKDVTSLTEYRYECALYTLEKAISETKKKSSDRPNVQYMFQKFLKELLIYARDKKNILEFCEVTEFFKDLDLSIEQMELVFDFLEKNNIDVLRIDDDFEEVEEVVKTPKKQVNRPNRYATEEERLAARRKTQQKYRKKKNVTNDFSLNKYLDAADVDPYGRSNSDLDLLSDIGSLKNDLY